MIVVVDVNANQIFLASSVIAASLETICSPRVKVCVEAKWIELCSINKLVYFRFPPAVIRDQSWMILSGPLGRIV